MLFAGSRVQHSGVAAVLVHISALFKAHAGVLANLRSHICGSAEGHPQNCEASKEPGAPFFARQLLVLPISGKIGIMPFGIKSVFNQPHGMKLSR